MMGENQGRSLNRGLALAFVFQVFEYDFCDRFQGIENAVTLGGDGVEFGVAFGVENVAHGWAGGGIREIAFVVLHDHGHGVDVVAVFAQV